MSTERSHSVPEPLRRAALWSGYFLLIVAGALALLYVIVRLRLIFIPAFIAVLLATLLAPLVDRLRARGWKPLPATATVLLGSVLVLVAIFSLLVPQLVDQFDEMRASATEGFDEIVRWLGQGPLELSEEQIDGYLDQAAEQIRANSSAITGGILAGATRTFEFIAGFLLALVLLFFFLKDGPEIAQWFRRQVARRNREHVDEMARRAWATLSGYVRGTAIIALVDAVLIGLALVLVGNPLWIPLAVITFFGAFFPIVGAVVAGTVAALVTLVTNGLTSALIVTGAIIVIQQLEGDVLQPVVMGKAVRLHPIAILIALTAGGVLGGIAGAFVGVPTAAVGATVGNYVKHQLRAEDDLLEEDRAADEAIDSEG